jgi:uncharacterized protein GlcG (DUF336 family)
MPVMLAQAHALIDHAQSHAATMGLRVTVAVVDEGGMLQALSRMDGAPRLSAQIAEAKAVGAAVWDKDGDQLASLQSERPAFFEHVGRLTRVPVMPAAGSVVIRDGAAILGAVGVSGASSEEDHECAQTALRAMFASESGG